MRISTGVPLKNRKSSIYNIWQDFLEPVAEVSILPRQLYQYYLDPGRIGLLASKPASEVNGISSSFCKTVKYFFIASR